MNTQHQLMVCEKKIRCGNNMDFYRREMVICLLTTYHCLFCFVLGEVERSYIMRESKFQANLKKKLKSMFPGCIVTKMDPTDIQGMPDLLILYKNKWATLELKRSRNATHQPNQDYYVDKMNEMSFSRFIFPENEEEVLHELQQSLES